MLLGPYAPGPMSSGKKVPIVFDAKGQVGFDQLKVSLTADFGYIVREEDMSGGTPTESRETTLTASGSVEHTLDRIDFLAGYLGGGSGALPFPDDSFCAIRHPRWAWAGLAGWADNAAGPHDIISLSDVSIAHLFDAALTVHVERTVSPPTGNPLYDSPSIDFHDNLKLDVGVESSTHRVRWSPQLLIEGGSDFPSGTLLTFSYPDAYGTIDSGGDFAGFVTDVRRGQLLSEKELFVSVPQPADVDEPFFRRTWLSWTAEFDYKLVAL